MALSAGHDEWHGAKQVLASGDLDIAMPINPVLHESPDAASKLTFTSCTVVPFALDTEKGTRGTGTTGSSISTGLRTSACVLFVMLPTAESPRKRRLHMEFSSD